MPIPSSDIETPEVVLASPGEMLEQTRDRLESPNIENKWRAFVVVQDDEGRYAVVPVLGIRPLVWEEGPSVLKRPLRELGLLHFQPGAEQSAVDLKEAEQLADGHGGWLVVLRDGHYAGLLRGRRRVSDVALQPDDAFDLFDELLSDSLLAETEFIEATLQTTVAKVAMDLKSTRDPESACILVRMDDGSFRVMASRELDERVQMAEGDLWAMPLHVFVPHLQGAEATVRERGMIGREQAQRLADREEFLVVTQNGEPLGLLVSQVVQRAAGHPPAISLGGFIYSLFNVPQELLRRYQSKAELEKKPRFVNLWLEDLNQKTIERSRPLIVGRACNLALNVGGLREDSLVDWEGNSGGPQAIVEPQETDAYLYASLSSQDFYIPEPTQSFRLPRHGDAEPVRFQVTPLHRSYGADLAELEVCLYYRTYLVQTFQVRVEVVARGEVAQGSQPQSAQLTHARTSSFPDMERLPPRELSLTITRDSADQYRFTFLVDPDSEDEASASRAIALSCSVRLTRDDLTHLITKARRQLYNVVQAFDLLQDPDAKTYHRATRALAQVGRQLYLKLFESRSAQALKEWMETSLPDGSTIQVVDLAGDFVFPWSLVYTARPWGNNKPIDVKKFWGWRFKLAILTSTLLDTYREAHTEIATDSPLRVSVGLYERLLGTDKQKAFFADLSTLSSQRIVPEILRNRRNMNRALAAADRDLYYFFCHGYTERMATDIQPDADLLSLYARLTADAGNTARREHMDDLFDVSDSWIRLTRGKIPLTMLKETVPDRFSRHPLVFLNMCESAQVFPSLSDGFVPFFIGRGARAIVGTECSMNTIFADDFARGFLTRFFRGEAAGDILLALRRHYLDKGNPLALAYTVYCDADLRLSEPLLPSDQSINTEGGAERSEDQACLDAVEALWNDDMDGLMLTLAARAQAEQAGGTQDELQMWAPPVEAFAADVEAGPEWTAQMVSLGQKLWQEFEPEIHDLLCNEGNDKHRELIGALMKSAKMLAVALAPALVTQVPAFPAVAIVLATVAAKKIAEMGLEAVCEMWAVSTAKEARL